MLPDRRPLPLPIAAPPAPGLARWLAERRQTLDALLSAEGVLLLEGTGLEGAADFGRAIAGFLGPLSPYMERSSPRRDLGANVYTSTEHPPSQPIPLHNENSYQQSWPLRLAFFCQRPAASGGGTLLADTRAVLRRLPAPLVQTFTELGILYVRNYRRGLGLTWQAAFQTQDRHAVEAYCRARGLSVEWPGSDWLRTTARRPALAQHPETGAPSWFNHAAFFHVSTLDPSLRETLLAEFDPRDLPANTYFGDGTPIEDAVIAEIRQAYQEETRTHRWKQGDLLLIDNMCVAHGREPYAGAREVLVAMARPCSERCLPA